MTPNRKNFFILLVFILLQTIIAFTLIPHFQEENFVQNIIIFGVAFIIAIIFVVVFYKRQQNAYNQILEIKNTLEQEVTKRTKELRESENLFKTIIETVPIPVFYKDLEGRYILCNKAFSKLTNIEQSKIIGLKSQDLFSTQITQEFNASDKKALEQKNTYHFESTISGLKSKPLHVVIYKKALITEEKPIGIIGAIHDITKQKNAQQKLEKSHEKLKIQQSILEKNYGEIKEHAYKDELTKLYNRKKFNEELETFLQLFARYADPTALVLFDIDKFKEINDIHGHLIGDQILKDLATIISINTRECDILARWGGEEFTIILPKTTKENALLVVKKLREKIIYHDFGIKRSITCSFGITAFSQNDDANSLIKRVDDMLYEAKNKGRDMIIHD
ncbi:MAG: diguanylate cyclase [Sulfurospirillum sp.]|nr:diguanylate cyclase [Sulfurospirillum sp.]